MSNNAVMIMIVVNGKNVEIIQSVMPCLGEGASDDSEIENFSKKMPDEYAKYKELKPLGYETSKHFYLDNRKFPLLNISTKFNKIRNDETVLTGITYLDESEIFNISTVIDTTAGLYSLRNKLFGDFCVVKCMHIHGFSQHPETGPYCTYYLDGGCTMPIVAEYDIGKLARSIAKEGDTCAGELAFGLLISSGSILFCLVMPKYSQNIYNKISKISDPNRRLIEAKRFLYRIAEILSQFHDNGFYHGDIKPHNVLLNYSRASINYKTMTLCDFGLSSNGPANYLCSTSQYRAPEVFLGGMWAGPSDIWSLGCCFLEMLTGAKIHVDHPIFCSTDEEFLKSIGLFFGPYPDEMLTKDSHKFLKNVTKKYSFRDLFDSNLDYSVAGMAEALDLVRKMLVIDPNQRISAKNIIAELPSGIKCW